MGKRGYPLQAPGAGPEVPGTPGVFPGAHFRLVEVCRHKLLDEFLPKLEAAVALLPEDAVRERPNEASHSVGNLILHSRSP